MEVKRYEDWLREGLGGGTVDTMSDEDAPTPLFVITSDDDEKFHVRARTSLATQPSMYGRAFATCDYYSDALAIVHAMTLARQNREGMLVYKVTS